MQVIKAADHATQPANPQYFTGSVWVEAIAAADPPSRLNVARVTFAPAARTAWHTHPLGQILLAVSGIGRVQKAGEPISILHPGDSVVILPGERHWHGAGPDDVFVHVALQQANVEGQQADWLEPVSDQEYSGSFGG